MNNTEHTTSVLGSWINNAVANGADAILLAANGPEAVNDALKEASAAGVQIGTRFVMTEECSAHAKFKDAFLHANARDAIATPQFDSRLPVVAVRALKNKGHDTFAKLQLALIRKLEEGSIHRQEAQMEVEKFWMGALRRAVVEGDVETGSLMAGQSVGLMDRIVPVRELIDELLADASAELDQVKAKLS